MGAEDPKGILRNRNWVEVIRLRTQNELSAALWCTHGCPPCKRCWLTLYLSFLGALIILSRVLCRDSSKMTQRRWLVPLWKHKNIFLCVYVCTCIHKNSVQPHKQLKQMVEGSGMIGQRNTFDRMRPVEKKRTNNLGAHPFQMSASTWDHQYRGQGKKDQLISTYTRPIC